MANLLYNYLFKRSSTFTVIILASAFAFERIVDVGSNTLFENINKGKLWKDIKHKYES